MNDPRYPIGMFELPGELTPAQRVAAIATLAAVPNRLCEAVRDLGHAQLDTPYRTGGWTVRQVVHHVADSHLNAYARIKRVAAEREPALEVWDENAWTRLPDVAGPIGASLALVQAVHERLVHCLRGLPERAFARVGLHSHRGRMTLDDLVAMYAWHGEHHIAHILRARSAVH